MAQCAYHPDKRGSAQCPQCKQQVCDRCRLNGSSRGCMTCHAAFSKGEGASKRKQCENHQGVVTDLLCKGCRKPHCPACLNTQSVCFRCATAAPKAPPPTARGPRKGGKTGKLKGAKTGKLKAPPPRPKLPGYVLPAGLGVLVAAGAAFFLLQPAPEPPQPYMGPAGVQIVSPRNGATLRGNVDIALKVVAPEELEKVELTVDGKYWDEFTAPPFKSQWQTPLINDGPHVIQAQAVYKGGEKRAIAKLSVRTRNRRR